MAARAVDPRGQTPASRFSFHSLKEEDVIQEQKRSRISLEPKNRSTKTSMKHHSRRQRSSFNLNSKCLLYTFSLTTTLILIFSSRLAFVRGQDGEYEQPAYVDPCEACRLVVASFEKGMEETSRGKHEGGDTSWEEKNLKSYPDSEVRLVEIQEQLCEEVKLSAGKAQCLSVAEDSEAHIEDWWFNHRNKNVRLHDYLCISKTKHCCPKNSFGPKCQPCPPSDCNKHGHCDGSGTRSGSGQCKCDDGYSGQFCDECSQGYYRIETTDGFNCRQCDPVCKDCYGPDSMNCTVCRDGYQKDATNACVDIDECELSYEKMLQDPKGAGFCKGNKYCINTDGSYRCAECHHACSGCLAYGPNMCVTCSVGYKFDSERICREVDEDGNFEDRSLEFADRQQSKDDVFLSKMIFFIIFAIISVAMMRSNTYAICVFAFMFVATYFMDKIILLNDNIRTF